jgi:transcription elongation factor GreA
MPKEKSEVVLLTKDGYKLKKQQLEEYKRILYEEIPKKLKQAKEHGGELRENKEYIDLKRDQDYYDSEVSRLEDLLDRAKVIDESSISTEYVTLGSKVILEDRDEKRVKTYKLVSPAEVDPENNNISTQSPVGRGLMGLSIGAEIEVDTPSGRLKYRILGIERG